jgi:thioredoxin-dependent peroxiredoxin
VSVVIYFYPADDTPGCTKEACQFNDGWGHFASSGSKCSASRPTAPTNTSPFAEEVRPGLRPLERPEKKVMTKYGAYGEKMMYGKKVTGRHPLDLRHRSHRHGSSTPGTAFEPTATPTRCSRR